MRGSSARVSPLAVILFAFVGPLALFSSLADEVREREPVMGDFGIPRFLHAHASGPLDSTMTAVSVVGAGPLLVLAALAAAAGLLALRQRPLHALFVPVSVLGAHMISHTLKPDFHRARPHLWQPIHPAGGFAFPSGHATQSMAFAAALAFVTWHTRWRLAALLVGGCFVVAVGVSRVYLGVHYPSDVLAGWCLALAWVTAFWLFLWATELGLERRRARAETS